MHGRVKVLRTEEQEKIRKAKKEKVEREFKRSTDTLLESRINNDFSEIQLTHLAAVLQIVPDVNTLWNYRREILEHILSSKLDKIKYTSLLNTELELTAACAKDSPKSYAIWHHREWAIRKHNNPDWKREIEFCNAMLQCDERNFHCWDYRRLIFEYGNVTYKSESKAMDDLIESNFSNFSAWHYRGELLELPNARICSSHSISPPPAIINEPFNGSSFLMPKNELELTYNAIFTDPNDQSPWLYYWWILGRGVRRSYMRELYISRHLKRVVMVFTSGKPRSTIEHLDVFLKVTYGENSTCLTVEKLGGWKSADDKPVSPVWWFSIDPDIILDYIDTNNVDELAFEVTVCIRDLQNSGDVTVCRVPGCTEKHLFCLKCKMDSSEKDSVTRVSLDPLRLLNPAISPSHDPEDLSDNLDKIEELLSLEPDNKWALLTVVDLLRFVRPTNYLERSVEAMNRLIKVDGAHTPRYDAMKSAHSVQDLIANALEAHTREISFASLKLFTVGLLDWCALMTKVDLSNNSITSLPKTLCYLVCLVELIVDHNQLKSLSNVACAPSLLRLSVQHNFLEDFESIEEMLMCPQLENVALHGNKVTKLSSLTEQLSEHPKCKCRSQALQVNYDKSLCD